MHYHEDYKFRLLLFLSQEHHLDSIKIIDDELLTKFQNKDYATIYNESKKKLNILQKDEELYSLYSILLALKCLSYGKDRL